MGNGRQVSLGRGSLAWVALVVVSACAAGLRADEPGLANPVRVFATSQPAYKRPGQYHAFAMRLSPDGKRVMYSRPVAGGGQADARSVRYELVLRELNGGKETLLPIEPLDIGWRSVLTRFNMFDPAGKRLALPKVRAAGTISWSIYDVARAQAGVEGLNAGAAGPAKFTADGEALLLTAATVPGQPSTKLVSLRAPRAAPRALAALGWVQSVSPAGDVASFFVPPAWLPGLPPEAGRTAIRLVLWDLKADKELVQVPTHYHNGQLENWETQWTPDGRYLYYADLAEAAPAAPANRATYRSVTRVWDRQAGKAAGEIADALPVGPGPGRSQMVLARRTQDNSGGFLLHDAATGREYPLGDAAKKLIHAGGGKVIYAQTPADSETEAVFLADLVAPSPQTQPAVLPEEAAEFARLSALLGAGNPLAARDAAKAMGKLKSPAAAARLIEALPGASAQTAMGIALALGNLGDPRAVPALMATFDRKDALDTLANNPANVNVATTAHWALIQITCQEKNWDARTREGMAMLAASGTPGSFGVSIETPAALAAVRAAWQARLAFPATQPTTGRIPALIGQLGSPSATEREEAQKALVEIGPEAVEGLKAATADKDTERAKGAKQVIARIGANTATKPARPLAWRDEESDRLIGMAEAALVKRLGPATLHANAEPAEKFLDSDALLQGAPPGRPVGVVGHYYMALRPDAALVIRCRVKDPVVFDAYWCRQGEEGAAFFNPPPRTPTTSPATQPAAGRIPALIGQLGSASAKEREEAQKALVEIGPTPRREPTTHPAAEPDLSRPWVQFAAVKEQVLREGDALDLGTGDTCPGPEASILSDPDKLPAWATSKGVHVCAVREQGQIALRFLDTYVGSREGSAAAKWWEQAQPYDVRREIANDVWAGMKARDRRVPVEEQDRRNRNQSRAIHGESLPLVAEFLTSKTETGPRQMGLLAVTESVLEATSRRGGLLQRLKVRWKLLNPADKSPTPSTAPIPASQPAASRIPALIGQLGSASAKEREEAQKALVERSDSPKSGEAPSPQTQPATERGRNLHRAATEEGQQVKIVLECWNADGTNAGGAGQSRVYSVGKPSVPNSWAVETLQPKEIRRMTDALAGIGFFDAATDRTYPAGGPPPTWGPPRPKALPGYMLHVLLAGGKTAGEMYVDLSEGGERQMLVAFKQIRPATQLAAESGPAGAGEAPVPATQPAAGRIPALIGQLGSDDYRQRDRAQQELVQIGAAAVPKLEAASSDTDMERARRARAALAQIRERAAALRAFGGVRDDALVDLAKLRGLKALDLYASDITDEGLSQVNVLSGLESLTPPRRMADAGMAHVAGLANLKELNLHLTEVTDAGLACLKGLGQLESLSVPCQATDAGLVHLEALPRLKKLSLDGTKVTAAGLARLEGRSQLVELNLNAIQVTDEGVAHLKGLTNLKYLHVGNSLVTDAGLAHLKGLTGLEHLEVFNCKITDEGLGNLMGMTNLKALNIGWTSISDEGVRRLAGLKNIESLSLRQTEITDAGLAHVKGLSHLKDLDLWSTGIGDAGVRHLAGMTRLIRLRLKHTKVTDAGLAHVRDLTNLEDFDFPETITDAGLSHLKKLTKVKKVDAPRQMTDAGLAHLKDWADLTTLNLGDTRVTDAGLVYVKGMKRLETLSLNNTAITDAGLTNLEGLSALKKLNLRETRIGDAGLAHLKGLGCLEHLYLRQREITDAGLVHLAGLRKMVILHLYDATLDGSANRWSTSAA
ncbi:MAG: hypothetical protein NTV86_16565 [Planctomycetota bacterium]|nr:hypothetical protein [Planctomycetota bacterium]